MQAMSPQPQPQNSGVDTKKQGSVKDTLRMFEEKSKAQSSVQKATVPSRPGQKPGVVAATNAPQQPPKRRPPKGKAPAPPQTIPKAASSTANAPAKPAIDKDAMGFNPADGDDKYNALVPLIEEYNRTSQARDGTPQNEKAFSEAKIALSSAASQYLVSAQFGGGIAVNPAHQQNVEELIYKIFVSDDVKAAANSSIENMWSGMVSPVAPGSTKRKEIEAGSSMDVSREFFRGVVAGSAMNVADEKQAPVNVTASKALQTIVTGTFAQLQPGLTADATPRTGNQFRYGGKVDGAGPMLDRDRRFMPMSAMRRGGGTQTGYEASGEINATFTVPLTRTKLGDKKESVRSASQNIGTTLHELSHVANVDAYENAMTLGASGDSSKTQLKVQSLARKAMLGSMETSAKALGDGSPLKESLLSNESNRFEYAGKEDKVKAQYYPETRKDLQSNAGELPQGSAGAGKVRAAIDEITRLQTMQFPQMDSQKLSALKTNQSDAKASGAGAANATEAQKKAYKKVCDALESYERGPGSSDDDMNLTYLVEYDAVLPQMLVLLETMGDLSDPKAKELHEKVKAAALDIHIQRMNHLEQKKIAGNNAAIAAQPAAPAPLAPNNAPAGGALTPQQREINKQRSKNAKPEITRISKEVTNSLDILALPSNAKTLMTGEELHDKIAVLKKKRLIARPPKEFKTLETKLAEYHAFLATSKPERMKDRFQEFLKIEEIEGICSITKTKTYRGPLEELKEQLRIRKELVAGGADYEVFRTASNMSMQEEEYFQNAEGKNMTEMGEAGRKYRAKVVELTNLQEGDIQAISNMGGFSESFEMPQDEKTKKFLAINHLLSKQKDQDADELLKRLSESSDETMRNIAKELIEGKKRAVITAASSGGSNISGDGFHAFLPTVVGGTASKVNRSLINEDTVHELTHVAVGNSFKESGRTFAYPISKMINDQKEDELAALIAERQQTMTDIKEKIVEACKKIGEATDDNIIPNYPLVVMDRINTKFNYYSGEAGTSSRVHLVYRLAKEIREGEKEAGNSEVLTGIVKLANNDASFNAYERMAQIAEKQETKKGTKTNPGAEPDAWQINNYLVEYDSNINELFFYMSENPIDPKYSSHIAYAPLQELKTAVSDAAKRAWEYRERFRRFGEAVSTDKAAANPALKL